MIDQSAIEGMKLAAYEAAANPALWAPFVQQVRTRFGATSVYLRAGGGGSPHNFWVDTGTDPQTRSLYVDHWVAQDPWAIHPQGHRRSRAGRCFIGSQFLPWDELGRTAFYNDFGRRCGIKGVMSAMVEDGSSGAAPVTKLALFREDGLPEFEQGLLPAFEALQPALRHAMGAHWAFESLRIRASAVEEALEALPSPLMLLRKDLQVEYANRPASAMNGASRLRISGGRLACVGQIPMRALQDLVAAAARGGSHDAALWMPSGTGFETGTLHLTGLLPESRLRAHWPAADVMLAVHMDDAAKAKEARLQAIAFRCRLTAMEAQVLGRLSSGETVDATAVAQRVRVTTVRTHIRHILDKTCSKRLVDLLRVLGD